MEIQKRRKVIESLRSLLMDLEELIRTNFIESLRSVLMELEELIRHTWELEGEMEVMERARSALAKFQRSMIIPLNRRPKYWQFLNFEERLRGGYAFRPQSTDKFEIPEDFPKLNMKRNPLHDFDLRRAVILIFSTVVVIGTYRSASRSASTKSHSPDSLFISCNSAVFVASLCVVIHLLNHFQLKPWPQIAFSMLFGCYILISPAHVLPLLVLSIPLLLLAAASGKLSGTGEA